MKKSDSKNSILRLNLCTYIYLKNLALCSNHSMSFVLNQFMLYFKRLCDENPKKYEKYYQGIERGLILKEDIFHTSIGMFEKVIFHFTTNQFLYNVFKKFQIKYHLSLSKLVDFIVCEVGMNDSSSNFISYLSELDEKKFNELKRNLANFNLKRKKI